MLVAYIDGSHNEDIEVVSGFVASKLAWQTFDGDWQALLAKYNIPKRFHATEYWARRRPTTS